MNQHTPKAHGGAFSPLATAWKNEGNNLNWTTTPRLFAMQSLTLWSSMMVTVVEALSILPDWVQCNSN